MAIGEFLRAAEEGRFNKVVEGNQGPVATCHLRALAIGVDEGGIGPGLDVGG